MKHINPKLEKMILEDNPQVIICLRDDEDRLAAGILSSVCQECRDKIIEDFIHNWIHEHLENLPF